MPLSICTTKAKTLNKKSSKADPPLRLCEYYFGPSTSHQKFRNVDPDLYNYFGPPLSTFHQKFRHVTCWDAELYEHYFSDMDVAKEAVRQLVMFSWEYRSDFFTDICLEAMIYYKNSRERSVFQAVMVFTEWLHENPIPPVHSTFPKLDPRIVARVLPFAKKTEGVEKRVLGFGERFVEVNGNLASPFSDTDIASPDLAGLREHWLWEVELKRKGDGLWENQGPSLFHLSLVCLGYSAEKDELVTWVKAAESEKDWMAWKLSNLSE